MIATSELNSLRYDPQKCVNCELCIFVCPHAVFTHGENVVVDVKMNDCMECGACAVNCPTEAIEVDSGVGCAYAMMRNSITGQSDSICSANVKTSCG